MTYTYEAQFLRSATASFLVAGIITIVGSGTQALQAQSFGQGAVVMHAQMHASEPVLKPVTFHSPASAPQQGADIELQLMIGMLLVLAGCTFHALSFARAYRIPAEQQSWRRQASKKRKVAAEFFHQRSV
jgi:hypothetical protein